MTNASTRGRSSWQFGSLSTAARCGSVSTSTSAPSQTLSATPTSYPSYAPTSSNGATSWQSSHTSSSGPGTSWDGASAFLGQPSFARSCSSEATWTIYPSGKSTSGKFSASTAAWAYTCQWVSRVASSESSSTTEIGSVQTKRLVTKAQESTYATTCPPSTYQRSWYCRSRSLGLLLSSTSRNF